MMMILSVLMCVMAEDVCDVCKCERRSNSVNCQNQGLTSFPDVTPVLHWNRVYFDMRENRISPLEVERLIYSKDKAYWTIDIRENYCVIDKESFTKYAAVIYFDLCDSSETTREKNIEPSTTITPSVTVVTNNTNTCTINVGNFYFKIFFGLCGGISLAINASLCIYKCYKKHRRTQRQMRQLRERYVTNQYFDILELEPREGKIHCYKLWLSEV